MKFTEIVYRYLNRIIRFYFNLIYSLFFKLFDLVKKERGTDITNKVEAIPGDVSLSDLGISTKDRERITSEVEIIFHCAATVRFDEPLKKAALLNVRGTKLMLELAKTCGKLLVSMS